jgi:hypothetical protein
MGCECMTNIATWFDGLVDLPMLNSRRGYAQHAAPIHCHHYSGQPILRDAVAELQHKIVSPHGEVVTTTSQYI